MFFLVWETPGALSCPNKLVKPLLSQLNSGFSGIHNSVSRLNVEFLNSVDDIAISEEEITLCAPLKI